MRIEVIQQHDKLTREIWTFDVLDGIDRVFVYLGTWRCEYRETNPCGWKASDFWNGYERKTSPRPKVPPSVKDKVREKIASRITFK